MSEGRIVTAIHGSDAVCLPAVFNPYLKQQLVPGADFATDSPEARGAGKGVSPEGGGAVDVIFSPLVRLWNWVDQVGGYPGQIFFVCAIIMLLLGVLTWYGNKR
jgi:hypothetical protein